MDQLRCDSAVKRTLILAGGFAAVLLSGLSCQGAHPYSPQRSETPAEENIVVTNSTPAGSFEIENRGRDIDLSLAVTVQQFYRNEWKDRLNNVKLVEQCGVLPKDNHIVLLHGQSLRPVPWTGFSCSAQCSGDCRANMYMGPDTFRFAVTEMNGKRRFYSPAFLLPAEGDRR
jgi:hypothetical protein